MFINTRIKAYNSKLSTGPSPIRDVRINSRDRKLIPFLLMEKQNPQQAQFMDPIQILQDDKAHNFLTKSNEDNIFLQDSSPVMLRKNKPRNEFKMTSLPAGQQISGKEEVTNLTFSLILGSMVVLCPLSGTQETSSMWLSRSS